MLTWSYLQKFNCTNPPNEVLPRTKEIQRNYDSFCKFLKEKNIKVSDHIIKTLDLTNKKIVFTDNTFPYNCEPNVVHKLLWIYKESIEIDNVQQIIEKKILELFNLKLEFIFYENKTCNKSIKDITHYHVFVLLK